MRDIYGQAVAAVSTAQLLPVEDSYLQNGVLTEVYLFDFNCPVIIIFVHVVPDVQESGTIVAA